MGEFNFGFNLGWEGRGQLVWSRRKFHWNQKWKTIDDYLWPPAVFGLRRSLASGGLWAFSLGLGPLYLWDHWASPAGFLGFPMYLSNQKCFWIHSDMTKRNSETGRKSNSLSFKNPFPQTLFHSKTLSRKHFFIQRPPEAKDRRRPKAARGQR